MPGRHLAHDETALIAQDGAQGPAVLLLAANPRTTQAVDLGRPLDPRGTTVGGFTLRVGFTITAKPGDRLTWHHADLHQRRVHGLAGVTQPQ